MSVNQLEWGVTADGVLVAAFRWRQRAEQFKAFGVRDSPSCMKIEVVYLGSPGTEKPRSALVLRLLH